MRILLSLLALSSCLLLTMAHGAGVMRIEAYLRPEDGAKRGGPGTLARMDVPGATLSQLAGDFTRRLSGAATGWSG